MGGGCDVFGVWENDPLGCFSAESRLGRRRDGMILGFDLLLTCMWVLIYYRLSLCASTSSSSFLVSPGRDRGPGMRSL